MKKSLVVLVVIALSLAVAGMACAEWKCSYKAIKGPFVPPRCITVPAKCPVKLPGTPFAYVPGPRTVIMKKTPVFTPICLGKDKGMCVPCGPCGPKITWGVKWATLIQCGTYKYPVPGPHSKKKVLLQCKTKWVHKCLW